MAGRLGEESHCELGVGNQPTASPATAPETLPTAGTVSAGVRGVKRKGSARKGARGRTGQTES